MTPTCSRTDLADFAVLSRVVSAGPFVTRFKALFILTEASKVLRDEPNLLEVDAPITGKLPLRPARARHRSAPRVCARHSLRGPAWLTCNAVYSLRGHTWTIREYLGDCRQVCHISPQLN